MPQCLHNSASRTFTDDALRLTEILLRPMKILMTWCQAQMPSFDRTKCSPSYSRHRKLRRPPRNCTGPAKAVIDSTLTISKPSWARTRGRKSRQPEASVGRSCQRASQIQELRWTSSRLVRKESRRLYWMSIRSIGGSDSSPGIRQSKLSIRNWRTSYTTPPEWPAMLRIRHLGSRLG